MTNPETPGAPGAPGPPASPAPAPSRRGCGCGCGTLVLGCLGVIVLLVVVVVAGVVFAWWQWTSTPDYWDTHRARVEQLTPAERDQQADAVDQRFSRWFTDAHEADPTTNYAAATPAEPAPGERTLSLSFDEINAWLDRRLEGWMQQQEVDLDLPVREVILTSQDGKLIVAGDVRVQQFQQVVSAVINAQMLDDGDLYVHVESVRVGRFPVPTETVVRFARDQIPEDEQTRAFKQALEVFEGVTFTPAHAADGTEIRLTSWAIDDDGIDVTVTNTESPPRP